MATNLLNFYVLKNNTYTVRHFLIHGNKDNISEKLCQFYDDWNATINAVSRVITLHEITMHDILNHTYAIDDVLVPLMKSDTDLYTLGNSIKFYSSDDVQSNLLNYGYERDHLNNTAQQTDIFKILPRTNFNNNDGTNTKYLILGGSSMDCEFADYFMAFDSKDDAWDYLKLLSKGEIAPYIYLNSDYPICIDENIKSPDAVYWLDIVNGKYKNTKINVLPQTVFYGFDYFN